MLWGVKYMYEKLIDGYKFDKWKMDEIFRRKNELVSFYSDFFDNNEDAEIFIIGIFKKTTIENNKQLCMMNNIKRFSTMMDDVKSKYEIKLFFLISCIESLYSIASKYDLDGKRMILTTFLEDFLSSEEKEFITNGIQHSIADNKYSSNHVALNIDEISNLLSELRNQLVHEGVYNNFSFGDGVYPVLNNINIYEDDEKNIARKELKKIKNCNKVDAFLDEYKKQEKYQRTYEVNITFDALKNILIKGMIRFVNTYSS